MKLRDVEVTLKGIKKSRNGRDYLVVEFPFKAYYLAKSATDARRIRKFAERSKKWTADLVVDGKFLRKIYFKTCPLGLPEYRLDKGPFVLCRILKDTDELVIGYEDHSSVTIGPFREKELTFLPLDVAKALEKEGYAKPIAMIRL